MQETKIENAMCDLPYLRGDTQKYLFDGCKLLWHQDKLQDWFDGKRISPIHIDMGIHKSCNIKCIYCYGIYQKPSQDFIPKERLLLLAKDAKKAGVRSIAVIGDGEPTLNSGLYPFVDTARNIGLDVSVATNGLLLKEEQVKLLCQSCTWLRFNISAGSSKYDEIMGAKDGFGKVMRAINWAVKYGKEYDCTIGMQMVLIPQNFSEVYPLAMWARTWEVDYLLIKQFSNPEEGIPVNFDMDEYKRVEESLVDVEQTSTKKTIIKAKWRALNDTREITKNKNWGFDRCKDLPFIFQISGNGDCFPCGYLFGKEDYKYGSVVTERLTNILESDKYWSIIEKIGKMELKDLCKGQCRHCETNKFVHNFINTVGPTVERRLVRMCGGNVKDFVMKSANPPEHRNFV